MEKHPNVTVTGVMVSNAEYNQKQMAAMASGNTPNVARISGLVDVARAGLLLELDKYITAEDKADFVPVALADATVDGKIVRFPWNFGNNGMGITNLIYPPMFEAAGVDWKKIVVPGLEHGRVRPGRKEDRPGHQRRRRERRVPDRVPGQGRSRPTGPTCYNHGGRLLNDKETAFAVDSPEAIRGFQFIVDAIYKHKIAPKGAEAADNYGVITALPRPQARHGQRRTLRDREDRPRDEGRATSRSSGPTWRRSRECPASPAAPSS